MRKIKKSLILLFVLLSSLSINFSFLNTQIVQAQVNETCALTPDRIDGQGFNVSSLGFNVSSLGFNVSSLGFNVSSLGFNVSSLGFNVSSLESLVEEIVNNQATPKLLVDDLPNVITGSNFSSVLTYILIVDDFSEPTAHGYKVQKTIQLLIDAIIDAVNENDEFESSPNFEIVQVDIAGAGVDYDASQIATEIADVVDNQLPPNAHIIVNMSFGLVPCDDDNAELELTDEDTGISYPITKPFSFSEYEAGPSENRPYEPISPILECIVVHYGEEGEYGEESYLRGGGKGKGKGKGGGHDHNIEGYTAYFGYNNPNLYEVEIPIGSKNKITPHGPDQGQPTIFAPGLYHFVFSVDYDKNSPNWKLGNKHAKVRHHTPTCEGEIPEPPSQISPSGYSLTQYFVEQMEIPEPVVDEYFEHLFNSANEDETNSLANLQLLMRMYLQRSYDHANDGDPNTNFALIPVASAGNFAPIIGSAALKPAAYAEVIAVSASVGDTASMWQLSHNGNVIAPGVSVALETVDGFVTDIGAGTSHAAPYVSVLSGLWLNYPSACNFGEGLPPLNPIGIRKDANAIFTIDKPLDCEFNSSPTITSFFEGITLSEGATEIAGNVSDPNDDTVTLTIPVEVEGITVHNNYDGTWSIAATDGLVPAVTINLEVTADDGRGGVAMITVPVTVLNEVPTADLVQDYFEVGILESARLELINPFDPGIVDAGSLHYQFDCDTSDAHFKEPGTNYYDCAYNTPGTYAATATILDKDGGMTIRDATIKVIPSELSECYAEHVELYEPGRRKNGSPIPHYYSKPHKALGEPQNHYFRISSVSLGFAHGESPSGVIILSFGEYSIMNTDNPDGDFRVWETTFHYHRRKWHHYPEAVDVYAAINYGDWVYIGTTSDNDQAYDLGELPYANYIKLVDVTDPKRFNRKADGFDLDAIEGFACSMTGSDDEYEEEYEVEEPGEYEEEESGE